MCPPMNPVEPVMRQVSPPEPLCGLPPFEGIGIARCSGAARRLNVAAAISRTVPQFVLAER